MNTIKTITRCIFPLLVALCAISIITCGQVTDKITLKNSQKNSSFIYLGKFKPRYAREIQSSLISVGAEMKDRDYIIYKNWKDYLGPLGTKKARIQSGWAKCEKVKGRNNWAWLNEIIYDMFSQGIEPWMSLSYGNPIYPGGSGLHNEVLPSSEEALAAWEKYVSAIDTNLFVLAHENIYYGKQV